MVRKGHRPSNGDWRQVIEQFVVMRALERKEFRLSARKFQRILESEAIAVFRIARSLEMGHESVPKKEFLRTMILARLRDEGFTPRHYLLSGHLDRLYETTGNSPRRWYEQAKTLIDAAMRVQTRLQIHDVLVRNLRRRDLGRPPSVAMDLLLDMTNEWDVTALEIAERITKAKVNPEREIDDDDVIEQWRNVIKRARSRRVERLREAKRT